MTETRFNTGEIVASASPNDLGIAVVAFEVDVPREYDAFDDMLPLMLSSGQPERPEPRFDELDPGKTHTKYVEKIQERERLAAEGKVTAGKGVVIFHSDIGEKEKKITRNGREIEVTDYFHSESEGREHAQAAENLKHTIIKTMGHNADQVILKVGSREAINEALLDPRVGHVVFIGHANRSQLTIDPIYTYNWQETPRLTHLKKSFGVFGCGALKNNKYYPRIGSTFVDPKGTLYGVPGDYLDEGQPYQFDQLVRFSLDVLEGTPLANEQLAAS